MDDKTKKFLQLTSEAAAMIPFLAITNEALEDMARGMRLVQAVALSQSHWDADQLRDVNHGIAVAGAAK